MAILILADDLTGAADCAARCRGTGMPAAIALGPPGPPLPAGALAFTSDSRHLPAELAAYRVRELRASLHGLTGITWYKKIDSTLRGNLGAELDATLDALGRDCVLICPAFPAQGRGLCDGYLQSALPMAQPVYLPTLLERQSRRPVELVRLEDVRAGVAQLAARLAAARRQAQLLAIDALADEDLGDILAAVEQALPGVLLCGSAGMVGALAARWADRPGAGASPATATRELAELRSNMPALLVVGSGSAMARRQIAHLRRSDMVTAIEIDPTSAHAPALGPLASLESKSRRSALGDVLLHLPAPPPGVELDGPAARACAEGLAAAALPIIERLRPALLVLVGGDTAARTLGRLGVERLEVLRELQPGIPLTHGVDAEGRERLVILKAGNHGDAETLATLLRLAGIEN